MTTQTTEPAGLPELPEPDTHCFDEDTNQDVWSHSAEQMRSYALAAIEADRNKRAPMSDKQIRKILVKYSKCLEPGLYSATEFDCADDLLAFAHALLASTQQVAPKGFVLVPKEPTEEMLDVFPANRWLAKQIYKSMIAGKGVFEFRTLYTAPQQAQEAGNDAAVAAIQFALEADEGWIFLRRWSQGDFDICRRDWPEAPEVVHIGADPLYKKAAPAQSDIVLCNACVTERGCTTRNECLNRSKKADVQQSKGESNGASD